MGRLSVELAGRDSQAGWFNAVDGMADYRAGRLDLAIERLEKSHVQINSPPGQAVAELFLAMALHRAGRPVDARTVFDRASAATRQATPSDAPTWDAAWFDWLICVITQREAERILAGPAMRPLTLPAPVTTPVK